MVTVMRFFIIINKFMQQLIKILFFNYHFHMYLNEYLSLYYLLKYL